MSKKTTEVTVENETTETTEVQKEKFNLKAWAGEHKKQLAIGGGLALAAIGGFVLKALSGKDEADTDEPEEEDEEEEAYGTGEDVL